MTETEKVAILKGGSLPSDQASGEVIDILEQMLTAARSGEIIAIAVVGLYAYGEDSDICHVWHKPDGDPPPSRLIGALEILKRSILEHFY